MFKKSFTITSGIGLILFASLAFADGPSSVATGTPISYQVHIKKLGFSPDANKDHCIYNFVSSNADGTEFDLASVDSGAAIGTLMANSTPLPANTYAYICGEVKNGFEIVGKTSLGCTSASKNGQTVSVEDPFNPGHYYVKNANVIDPSTTCEVTVLDDPEIIYAPTEGENMVIPTGVTMTSTLVSFIQALPTSFIVQANGAPPTFVLSFDVRDTMQTMATSDPTKDTLFVQPPRPSVSAH